jgi:Zn-dependent protease with chaperone function
MILFLPRYLGLLSMLLLGPSIPKLLPDVAIGVTLLGVVALGKSFRGKSLALLGVLVLMVAQSLLLVFGAMYPELFREPVHFAGESVIFFPMLRDINLGVNLIGALAAGCVALFIEFGRSRISMSKAFPHLNFVEATPQLTNNVRRLAHAANIPAPEVAMVDSGYPSAFTVRANRHYTVAASIGLLESLTEEEVEACLAHEIAHLKNKDFRVRALATVAKLALFARPAGYFLEPAVYRAREFLADKTAARLIGGPGMLISALSKLKEANSLPEPRLVAGMSMCNLHVRKGFFWMFEKHPDLDARIQVLKETVLD